MFETESECKRVEKKLIDVLVDEGCTVGDARTILKYTISRIMHTSPVQRLKED